MTTLVAEPAEGLVAVGVKVGVPAGPVAVGVGVPVAVGVEEVFVAVGVFVGVPVSVEVGVGVAGWQPVKVTSSIRLTPSKIPSIDTNVLTQLHCNK
jgi:hypothetical protein